MSTRNERINELWRGSGRGLAACELQVEREDAAKALAAMREERDAQARLVDCYRQEKEALLRTAESERETCLRRLAEAERLAIRVWDLLTRCCVCGAPAVATAPICMDECDVSGDGECNPGAEWECDVRNVGLAVEAMRESVKR
jgi:hypothetical protein